jgi:hypothetical protein
MGEKTDAYRVWLEFLKERGCVEDLSIDGSITLRDPHGRMVQCEANCTGSGQGPG